MWRYVVTGVGIGGGGGAGIGAIGGGIPGAIVGSIIGGVAGGLTGAGVAALVAFLSPLTDAFKTTLNKYSDNYQKLEKERSTLQEDYRKTVELVKSLKAQLEKFQADASFYAEKIRKYEELLKDKDLIVNEKKEIIDELLKERKEAYERVNKLNKTISKLTKAYKSVSEELDSLSTELNKGSAELLSLSEDDTLIVRFVGKMSEEILRQQKIFKNEIVLGEIAKNKIIAGWFDLENKNSFYRQLSSEISLEVKDILNIEKIPKEGGNVGSRESTEKIILICGYGRIFNRVRLMLNLLENNEKDFSTSNIFDKKKKLEKIINIMIAAFELNEEEEKKVRNKDKNFILEKILKCIETEYQNARHKIDNARDKHFELSAQYNGSVRLHEKLCEKFKSLKEEYKDIFPVGESEALCFYREMDWKRERLWEEEKKKITEEQRMQKMEGKEALKEEEKTIKERTVRMERS